MKIQPVKGTRDFYPEDYAPLCHVFDSWRRVSLRHGFQEWEGPTLEPLELYVRKSGDEIVSQLFHLRDRADRELAMRPELTPTLARMIAARINALPRPIKWFSMPRMYRGERPQRGRLREFFQWNVDVVGVEDESADAECIAVALESLRDLGLSPADVVMRISDRRIISTLFAAVDMPDDIRQAAYALLDKAADAPPEVMAEKWGGGPGRFLPYERLAALLAAPQIEAVPATAALTGDAAASLQQVIDSDRRLMDHLAALDVADYCTFDLRVVRGLAYYTGAVFEAYDRAGRERAICGGGRYDSLLASVGGGDVPAVGFGMGDAVLSLMLADRKLLPVAVRGAGVFLIDAEPAAFAAVQRLAARLRRTNVACEFDYKRRPVGKQFAAASARGARFAVVIRADVEATGVVAVKDLASGRQADVAVGRLTAVPCSEWLS